MSSCIVCSSSRGRDMKVLRSVLAIVVVASLMDHIFTSSMRDEHLVGVFNNPGDRSTSIVVLGNLAHAPPNRNEFLSTVPGALSPLCHSHCITSMKLPSSGEQQKHVVVYLLQNGIAIHWFEYNGYTLIDKHSIFRPTPDCTPVQLVESCNKLFVVCAGEIVCGREGDGVLDFYELTLMGAADPVVEYRTCIDLLNGLAKLSNIVLADCETTTVVYADGSKIVEYEIEQKSVKSHTVSCDRVSALQHVDDNILLLYCSNGSTIFFSRKYEERVNISSTVRPYLCHSDRDTFIEVVSDSSSPHIRYGRHSLETLNTQVYHGTLRWGECFGEESTGGPFFAFQDDDGVSVISTSTTIFMFGSQSCRQPAVFDQRYIVLWQCSEEEEEEEEEMEGEEEGEEEEGEGDGTALYYGVTVSDSLTSFKIVIRDNYIRANFITFISDIISEDPTDPTTSSTDPTISSTDPPETRDQWELPVAVSTPVGVVLVFVIVIAAVIIVAVVIHKAPSLSCRKQPTESSTKLQGVDNATELQEIGERGEDPTRIPPEEETPLPPTPTSPPHSTTQSVTIDLSSTSIADSTSTQRMAPEGGDETHPRPIPSTGPTPSHVSSRGYWDGVLVPQHTPSPDAPSSQSPTTPGHNNPAFGLDYTNSSNTSESRHHSPSVSADLATPRDSGQPHWVS